MNEMSAPTATPAPMPAARPHRERPPPSMRTWRPSGLSKAYRALGAGGATEATSAMFGWLPCPGGEGRAASPERANSSAAAAELCIAARIRSCRCACPAPFQIPRQPMRDRFIERRGDVGAELTQPRDGRVHHLLQRVDGLLA